jgi:hypothetical protein
MAIQNGGRNKVENAARWRMQQGGDCSKVRIAARQRLQKTEASKDRGLKRQRTQQGTSPVEQHSSHFLVFLLRYFEPFAGGGLPGF